LRIKAKELNLDIKLKNIDAVKELSFFDNHLLYITTEVECDVINLIENIKKLRV
jgi:hypothetical protein